MSNPASLDHQQSLFVDSPVNAMIKEENHRKSGWKDCERMNTALLGVPLRDRHLFTSVGYGDDFEVIYDPPEASQSARILQRSRALRPPLDTDVNPPRYHWPPIDYCTRLPISLDTIPRVPTP